MSNDLGDYSPDKDDLKKAGDGTIPDKPAWKGNLGDGADKKKFRNTWFSNKILKPVVTSPIFEVLINFVPKPLRPMLKWIKERFKEPSTYQGLTAISGIIGYSLSPEMAEAIATAVVSIISVIQMIKKERKDNNGA